MDVVYVKANEIRPAKVWVDDDILNDLNLRLSLTEFPDIEAFYDPWNSGPEINYVKEFINYWKNSYNWRIREEKMNQLPHYLTDINGTSLHFIHIRSPRADAYPLLFSHGWPGSFLECVKMLPFLTNPINETIPAFHVVCPSLPGYAFSSRPNQPGMNGEAIALIFIELMKRLGYQQYIVQGGDWGSLISTMIAKLDPLHCKGIHINMLTAFIPIYEKSKWGFIKALLTFWKPHWFLSEPDLSRFNQKFSLEIFLHETGYFHVQATNPHSVSYAMHDSPAGLAAYFIDKYRRWSHIANRTAPGGSHGYGKTGMDNSGSNRDGDGLEKRWSKDEMIDMIMLYWVGESGIREQEKSKESTDPNTVKSNAKRKGAVASSFQLYYETFHSKSNLLKELGDTYISLPTGCAIFPGEPLYSLRSWVEYYFNVVTYTHLPSGGHFAAVEEPKLLAQDIQHFFRVAFPNYNQKQKDDL